MGVILARYKHNVRCDAPNLSPAPTPAYYC